MTAPPPVAGWFQDGFHAFLKPYLRRHFHTIAIERSTLETIRAIGDGPLIIYANHPSWWDPLLAHLVCRQIFPQRQFYAPIDAEALAKYQVFKKLGFYGVDLSGTRGAAEFLRTSMSILTAPNTSLWITPEGRFSDCRDHSAELMPGLAHLATKMPENGSLIPMALEYTFWDERLPECFARLGEPIRIADHAHRDKTIWKPLLFDNLRSVQLRLAQQVISRSPEPFESLLRGARGAGGFYDGFRRAKNLFSGRRFEPEHGKKFN